MNWNFTATTPDELANVGKSLLIASKQKHLDEQLQMTRLLEALSAMSILQFPVRVQNAGERGTPDFQVESAGQRIAIEASKIAVQDVEHARSLQRRELRQTLAISSLYRRKSKPRTKDEIIAEGFLTPAMVFPVSFEEDNLIWLEAVTIELDDKTDVLRGNHFDHGSQDWLTLWDRIGTAEGEIQQRIGALRGILAPRWQSNWYSRVFLQDEHFRWIAMFSATKHVFIPAGCC
jgi:hypothetical protein